MRTIFLPRYFWREDGVCVLEISKLRIFVQFIKIHTHCVRNVYKYIFFTFILFMTQYYIHSKCKKIKMKIGYLVHKF